MLEICIKYEVAYIIKQNLVSYSVLKCTSAIPLQRSELFKNLSCSHGVNCNTGNCCTNCANMHSGSLALLIQKSEILPKSVDLLSAEVEMVTFGLLHSSG